MKIFMSVLCSFACCSLLQGCMPESKNSSSNSANGVSAEGVVQSSDQKNFSIAGVVTSNDQSFSGVAKANDQDSLSVSSITNLRNRTFKNLEVNGIAELNGVNVQGQAYINGVLDARDSSFNTISISTTEMSLSDCTVNTITVRPSEPKREQVITLINTNVEKSITFEQGNGKVIVKNGSVVKGGIIGGKLVQ